MIIKVSPLIEKNCNFLRNFQSNSNNAQRQLVKSASDEQLLCFVEICLNILEGRVPLRKRHLRKLDAVKNAMRRLARVRTAKSARKTLLNQQGAGIPAIAGLLTSIVVPLLVDKFFEKKINRI